MNSSRYIGLYSLLIIIFLAEKGYSQDFRLINPNKILTYTKIDSVNYENYFVFVKVDSVKTDGEDSIYYFNRLLDTVAEPFCMTDTGALGVKMIIKNDTDATHIFFNNNGDSIFIKTKVMVDESWEMYKFPDNSYVKAYVTSKLYGGILPNISDSLFRIKLSVFSEDGVPLPGVFPDDTKMDITKNYGMVEFWPMDVFPEEQAALILRGITDPDTNYVDVDAETCFDFLLGNEFHYEETVVSPDGITHTLQKNFVLEKENFSDHVAYQMLRVLWQEIKTDFSTDTIRIIDTLEINYNYADYAFLDTIELKIFKHTKAGFSDWIQNDTLYAGLPYKRVYEWYATDDEYCLSGPSDILLPEQSYGDGFGMIHYFDSISAENSDRLDLVYFQKGLLQWGNPVSFDSLGFTGIETSPGLKQILVYPNPVSGDLYIQPYNDLHENFSVYVFNALGQMVKPYKCSFRNGSFIIDCSNLPAGNYLIRLAGAEFVYTAKFVKD